MLTVLLAHSWEEDFGHYFEAGLRFIQDRGLVPLGRKDFLEHLETHRPFPANSILITLDDGALQDQAAANLLARYDLPAVVFAIPEPRVPERYYRQPMNWHLWKAFERQGRVAVEAHSLTHAKVFTSPCVAGYVLESVEGLNVAGLDERVGAPILETGPALTSRRYFPPEEVVERCVRFCAETLGRGRGVPKGEVAKALSAFLLGKGLADPDGLCRGAARPGLRLRGGRFETDAEFRRRVWEELVHSKALLERRLHKKVELFAYPFGAFTEELVCLVRKAGYRAAFTTHPEPFQVCQDPYRIGRFEMKRRTWQRLFL